VGDDGCFKVPHPFHPLARRRFELLSRRNNWGEERRFFRDASGQLCSIPTRWTSLAPPDPFLLLAAGRTALRVDDLGRLVALLQDVAQDRARP
jgi:hypothetical protein